MRLRGLIYTFRLAGTAAALAASIAGGVASAQVVGDPIPNSELIVDGPPRNWIEISVTTAAANTAHALGGVTLFASGSPAGPVLVRAALTATGSGPVGGWPQFDYAGVPAGTYYIVLIYGVVSAPGAPASAWRRVDFGQSCAGPPGMSTLALTVTGTTVTFDITGTSGTNGCVADSHVIQAGSAPGSTDLATFPAPSLNFAIPNVPAGDYYLRTYGVNAFGVGPVSLEMPIRVPGGTCTPPPAPENLSATVAGQVVTASWSLPGSPNPPVTFHELWAFRTQPGGGLTPFAPPFRLPAATTFSATAPSGSFTIFVRAASPCGKSPYSAGAAIVVP